MLSDKALDAMQANKSRPKALDKARQYEYVPTTTIYNAHPAPIVVAPSTATSGGRAAYARVRMRPGPLGPYAHKAIMPNHEEEQALTRQGFFVMSGIRGNVRVADKLRHGQVTLVPDRPNNLIREPRDLQECMQFINESSSRDTANVRCDGAGIVHVHSTIPEGAELLLWYGDEEEQDGQLWPHRRRDGTKGRQDSQDSGTARKSHNEKSRKQPLVTIDKASLNREVNTLLGTHTGAAKESMSLRLVKALSNALIKGWAHGKNQAALYYSQQDMTTLLNAHVLKRKISNRYENGTAPNLVKAATMMRVGMHLMLDNLEIEHEAIVHLQGSRSNAVDGAQTAAQMTSIVMASAGWTRGGDDLSSRINVAMKAAINADFESRSTIRLPRQYAWNHVGKKADHDQQQSLTEQAGAIIAHRARHDIGTPPKLRNGTILHLYAGTGPAEASHVGEALGMHVLSAEIHEWNWQDTANMQPFNIQHDPEKNVVERIMEMHHKEMHELKIILWSSPCSVTCATEVLFRNHGEEQSAAMMKQICHVKDDCMRVIEAQALKGHVISYFLEQGLHSRFWRMLTPNKNTPTEHLKENINEDTLERWPVPLATSWGAYGSQMHKKEGVCTNYAAMSLLRPMVPANAVPLVRNSIEVGVPDQPDFHARDPSALGHTKDRQLTVQEKRSEWPRQFVDHILLQYAQHSGDLPSMGPRGSVQRSYPMVCISPMESRTIQVASLRIAHERARGTKEHERVGSAGVRDGSKRVGSTTFYLRDYVGQLHEGFLVEEKTGEASWTTGNITSTCWKSQQPNHNYLGEIECTVVYASGAVRQVRELELLVQRDTWARDQARKGVVFKYFGDQQWEGSCSDKRRKVQREGDGVIERVYTVTYRDGDGEDMSEADIWWHMRGKSTRG